MEKLNKEEVIMLDNGTIRFSSNGESSFPTEIITVTYKDQIMYQFDHGRNEFPFKNNFHTLSLFEMKKFHDSFVEDCALFFKDIEDKEDNIKFFAPSTLGIISSEIVKIM